MKMAAFEAMDSWGIVTNKIGLTQLITHELFADPFSYLSKG